MTLKILASNLRRVADDNSPQILTAIGVAGSITATYLAGKASFKAAEILATERARRDIMREPHAIETKDKIKLVWDLYIPCAGVLVVTCMSIVTASRIGTKRTAAIAAAYSLSEKAFDEYRTKVVEKIGEKKEQVVRDQIAQDRMDKNPPGSDIVVIGTGEVMCYDDYLGRYFMGSMEGIKKAQNDTNYQVINQGYASLSDFYDRVGLEPTTLSDEVGWTTDRPLDLKFSTCMSPDGKPCISFGFRVEPYRNYFRN